MLSPMLSAAPVSCPRSRPQPPLGLDAGPRRRGWDARGAPRSEPDL